MFPFLCFPVARLLALASAPDLFVGEVVCDGFRSCRRWLRFLPAIFYSVRCRIGRPAICYCFEGGGKVSGTGTG